MNLRICKARLIAILVRINKNSFASKLVKNFAISFVGEGGAGVITFITTICLIRFIGNASYGILTVAYSFVVIVDALVNFQSWHAMIKFGSDAIERKDYGYLQSIIKIGLIIDFSTAFLGAMIIVASVGFFTDIMNWTKEITCCVYCLAPMVLFNFTGTSVGIIRLFDKFKFFSLYRVLTELFRLSFVIILCDFFNYGIYAAAVAYACGYILGYLLLFCFFLYTIRTSPIVSLRGILKSKTREHFKKIFSFTCWTNLSSSADIPVQQMDAIFLSTISYEVVAVFNVYKQIGQALTKLTVPLKQAVMPLFSERLSKGLLPECYSYFSKIRNHSLKILMPLVLLITIISLLFLSLVVDDSYTELWYVLAIYLLLRAIALSYAAIHPLMVAMGEVKLNFFYTLVANLTYIGLVSLLIRTMGLWAILLGLLFEYTIVITLKQITIAKKCKFKSFNTKVTSY